MFVVVQTQEHGLIDFEDMAMRHLTTDEHIAAMQKLKEEALRRGDVESLWVARLMTDALARYQDPQSARAS